MSELAKSLLQKRRKDYGLRQDGTAKGPGFLGELPNKKGGFSTELSIGVDGEDIPSLVPSLSKREINNAVNYNRFDGRVVRKAMKNALERRRQGKSVYKEWGE